MTTLRPGRDSPRASLRIALATTVVLVSLGGLLRADTAPTTARNVVLMIADGAGFNTWKATAMYEGRLGADFHDGPEWVALSASSHALRRHAQPPVAASYARTQIPSLVYDPLRAWDVTPVDRDHERYPYFFAGYEWLRKTASDSANTMSALVGGQKSYVGSLNVDGAGQPIEETLARLAHDAGKRVGIVTSVLFAHATPAAAAGVRNATRSNYCEIAVEMLSSPYPDFIAGCGHPEFDHNGRPVDAPDPRSFSYVGGRSVWETLKGSRKLTQGDRPCAPAAPDGTAATGSAAGPVGQPETAGLSVGQIRALESWTLRQSRERIESLSRGATPTRLLVVPQVGQASFWSGAPADPDHPNAVVRGGTLQQQRGSLADPQYTAPGYDPPIETVPSLATLTRVALNALDDDDDGFFLHVEGGAVDWAMHSNQLGRMIEEMLDFKRSIEAVTEWVTAHGGWDETLLIVTADHDHMLWGPDAHKIPFQPLEDRGPGQLPGYRWLSDGHSNALVPVFARGAGADRLVAAAAGEDPFYGPFVDQTDLYRLMRSALGGAEMGSGPRH